MIHFISKKNSGEIEQYSGEEDGFGSPHVEFEAPVSDQVGMMGRLFIGEEISLCNRQSRLSYIPTSITDKVALTWPLFYFLRKKSVAFFKNVLLTSLEMYFQSLLD